MVIDKEILDELTASAKGEFAAADEPTNEREERPSSLGISRARRRKDASKRAQRKLDYYAEREQLGPKVKREA